MPIFPCKTCIKINWKHIDITIISEKFETEDCYTRGIKKGNEIINAIPDKYGSYVIANIAEKIINANQNMQISDFKPNIMLLSALALGLNAFGVHFEKNGFPAMVSITYPENNIM